jgi:hypothetical protein
MNPSQLWQVLFGLERKVAGANTFLSILRNFKLIVSLVSLNMIVNMALDRAIVEEFAEVKKEDKIIVSQLPRGTA